MKTNTWPSIPFSDWSETTAALHHYAQIVGKYRLAHTPWVNHAWHATFYVTPRGITSSMIPDGEGGIEVTFDLLDHQLVAHCASGSTKTFPLEPMSVAEFLQRFKDTITALGGDPTFHGSPNELPEVIPFSEDTKQRPYDADAVSRFHRALVLIDNVLKDFRTGFRGKVSPVHLFWGSFDLAVTRFSGRPAPLHPGGIPNLPDDVTREAYSHEVSSAGFWAGGGPTDDAAFYSYAYPKPDGFENAEVKPKEAYWNADFGEFILPYEAVRNSDDPEAMLMEFLESTYVAAAELAKWDRSQECERGVKGKPIKIG